MTRNYSSISIQQKIAEVGSEPDVVATHDDHTLYRFADGVEAIETNGDTVWDNYREFGETKEWILCKGEWARRE